MREYLVNLTQDSAIKQAHLSRRQFLIYGDILDSCQSALNIAGRAEVSELNFGIPKLFRTHLHNITTFPDQVVMIQLRRIPGVRNPFSQVILECKRVGMSFDQT
jgi:hypothetical protein